SLPRLHRVDGADLQDAIDRAIAGRGVLHDVLDADDTARVGRPVRRLPSAIRARVSTTNSRSRTCVRGLNVSIESPGSTGTRHWLTTVPESYSESTRWMDTPDSVSPDSRTA